jgi:hypothetical protein
MRRSAVFINICVLTSKKKGLWFAKSGHLEVDGYSDFDWVGCQDDRRSTSSYCVFVGGNLVS